VLAPLLRSVAYPDNFKPNIQKYDSPSDPDIWLSTYYVAVKAADGNFDHMVTYFPLVMGEAPSLWLNNLPAAASPPGPTYPRPSRLTAGDLQSP
jgi:hypothetical protein